LSKRLNNFLVKEMDKIKDGAVFEKMQIIRRQLAEQGFTHVPYVNEVEDKNNISYAMLVDRPEGNGVNSSAVIRYKDAEFNPLEKSNRNAKFAQGGVAIKDQMSLAFNRGGDTKEIEPDLLDRVTDFFSRERGLKRSKKLEDAIRYYLGPYAGSLGQANQLLNPVVGLQDAGEATREGRYVDAVTDTTAAALPIAGALAVKPLARGVQSGIDEAVDAVTEVMTGGTFDKGRRKVLGTMVAAPVAVAAGSTGIVDELIAPLAKKVAGSGSLSGSLAKLKSLNSKRADLSIKMNKLLGDQSPYSYGVTSRIPPKNLIELENTDKILSSTIKETNKEFFENTLNLITETNLKKLSKEELEELSDKMFDGINSDLDGNNFEQIKGLTEKFNDKNILMAKEYERLGLDNNTYYNHLEMIDDELANFDDLPQGVKDAINNSEDRVIRIPLFNKGGTAMKDQMEMNFAIGGVAETVDPVSGNDVPPGSLPEEVRDDIPARLSEGEYVVPADVVRYYGVKFFEDLRTQAKMGLQQMDADGRIGGEPMEPQQAELSDDDLNSIIEQAMQQEQPMMANEGGVVGYKHGGYHPPDFLGMSVFGDKGDKEGTPYEFYDPDVGGYKPTAGDYGTTTPEAPTVTANVPDPVCPPGPNGERQRYDKSKGMCVPVSEGPTTEPEDPKPSVPFGSDFNDGQGVNWVDPADVLKFAKTFDTGMISKDVRTGAGLATAFIPGAAPIAALGALGGKIDATKDVAGLKASRIISAALGQTENVKQIGGILEDYEKKFGDGFSGTFGIGTGLNYAASALGVDRKDVKEFIEIYDSKGKSAEEKLKAQKTLEGLITNSKISEKIRKEKQEEAARRVAAATAAAASRQQILNANAAELARRKKQMEDSSDDYFDSGSSYKGEKTVSGAIQKMKDEGSFRRGGRATGGLVQKRKKKK